MIQKHESNKQKHFELLQPSVLHKKKRKKYNYRNLETILYASVFILD